MSPNPHAGPLVSLWRAGRHVGGRWLWRGLDVDVMPGDRLAVVGPSGAGKTLLLRALAGLDALDEGALLSGADRQPVEDLPRHRAAVAMVAQRPALFEGTVRDNLRAPFEYGVRGGAVYDEDAGRALLAALGREHALLDQSAQALSGGEDQTVGLARTLLTAPRVLILDEPTAGLDPDRTAAVEAAVDAFLAADPGRAAVWTGHDAAQLDRVTKRALRL